MHLPSDYLPIGIQALVALGFIVTTLGVLPFLGPKRSSKRKDENFECGIPGEGDARFPVSVKYLMVAILYVLFDVEVVFFYPYAVNFREMGVEGFLAVLIFVAVFGLGFFYLYKKGAFQWEK